MKTNTSNELFGNLEFYDNLTKRQVENLKAGLPVVVKCKFSGKICRWTLDEDGKNWTTERSK